MECSDDLRHSWRGCVANGIQALTRRAEGQIMSQVSREFTSEIGRLPELRQFVRECTERAWPEATAEQVFPIELAAQEAAANIILHAYEGQPGQPILLRVDCDAERVELALTHEGREFDPTIVPPPKLDGSRRGGFGCHMIHRLMDEVRYLHGESLRGIRLVKHRTTPIKENTMPLLVELFDEIAVATLNVEQLDVSNADDFRGEMEPVLREHHKLVLDLGRVQFVDSRGCGALLSCLKKVSESGGDLKLCAINGPVHTVFDLIRLHKICEMYDTKEQAVASFRPTPS
jgi:anti-sigma B factor antagonist